MGRKNLEKKQDQAHKWRWKKSQPAFFFSHWGWKSMLIHLVSLSLQKVFSGIYFLWSSKQSSLIQYREVQWFRKLWWVLHCKHENTPMKCVSPKVETFFQHFLLQRWPINPRLLSRKILSNLLLFAFSTNILQACIWDSPLSRLTHQDFKYQRSTSALSTA